MDNVALARRAADLAALQRQLETMTGALAANRPLDALSTEQALLGHEIADLAKAANLIRAQAEDAGSKNQAATQAALSAKALTEASQSSEQAEKQLRNLAEGVAEKSGHSAPARAFNPQADQVQQSQAKAVQSLQQAANALQQTAKDSSPDQPAPAPAAQPQAAPHSQAEQQDLIQGGQKARQAAENRNAEDALQSAAHLEQAAEAAARAARALGANARPQTLQTVSAQGNGSQDNPPTSEGIPVFALRRGLKLQDWLRLHGELGGDALQAVNAEGPEEYRPIIQRYFREVSGHGDKE